MHSDEFKANAVASCMQRGMSMAAVAMANGINANLLRRWVREAETGQGGEPPSLASAQGLARKASVAFVPMQLPAPAAPEIRIEVRRGEMTLTVVWPAAAATECSAWMRELLG
ncbi:MAG: transposase [Rubrivivax sp.]|nr:transposase [Rubrivivax sp.]